MKWEVRTMRSGTSFFNVTVWKKTVLRFWPIWAVGLVFWLMPVDNLPLMTAVFLTAATPVGANICVFAQQYRCDYEFSVVTVCLSTVLSVVTVPAMVFLAQTAFSHPYF